ncbi:hypothetical protein SAMN05444278_104189 [Psychroflexus salarius]|uniref:Uncharacterized protein n=1 Tax=Psychroflexus salarius TaxID=1155689 RepID=A0A1M4VS80_9FLAO|nr:hypothetical protein [Psychroflexus salarius]SHE71673.1 hypothetical protein SAMN05444278_104189 [Psychroflexus salarius]
MKKVLEDELISLAHRILKLKSRADIHQLKKEASILYEKLSVLSFAEQHFGGIRPTIGKKEFTEAYFKQYEDFDDDGDQKYPDGTEYNEDAISEPNTEKIKDIVSQMPPEAEQVDYLMAQFQKLTSEDLGQTKEKQPSNSSESKISNDDGRHNNDDLDNNETTSNEGNNSDATSEENLDQNQVDDLRDSSNKSSSLEEDFGVHFDDLPDFEPKPAEDSSQNKPTETTDSSQQKTPKEPTDSSTKEVASETSTKNESPTEQDKKERNVEDKSSTPKRTLDLFQQEKKSLNDQLQKGIKIGLNDRLAFTKQLFDGKVEDYNRVLSQLDSFSQFDEAKSFIELTIKPEYPSFEQKPEVYERFLTIIERKFDA